MLETANPGERLPLEKTKEKERELLSILDHLVDGGFLYQTISGKSRLVLKDGTFVNCSEAVAYALAGAGFVALQQSSLMARGTAGFQGIVNVYGISQEGSEYALADPAVRMPLPEAFFEKISAPAIRSEAEKGLRAGESSKENFSRDPDHAFPVPERLRDISREEVLEIAHDAGQRVMRRIREERDAIVVGKEIVSFPLPVLNHPGEVNSLISLSTTGCRYAHTGECVFCDYGHSELKRPEVIGSLKHQVETAFSLIEKEHEGRDWALINLTAIGSMLDPREVPEEILLDVCDRIANMVNSGRFPKGVEWTTESRLELVNEDVLQKIQAAFSKRDVEIGTGQFKMDIGYGLESSDPLIVEGVMYKRVGRSYADSVALMHEYGIEATAHTLFKPPFLTERESVEDAVKTVNEAFERSLCETMIVMTMNIRDATGVGELAEQGMYQLPSIWSVAEIMKRLGPKVCERTHFFGFSVANKDKANTVTPKDEEERRLMEMITAFSGKTDEWQAVVTFLDNAAGSEKKAWEELMRASSEYTLEARIAAGLDLMGKKYLGEGFEELADSAKASAFRKTKRLTMQGQAALLEQK